MSASNDLSGRISTTCRCALENSMNEGRLGIRVAIPIVAIPGCQRKLETPILRSKIFIDAQSVSERQPLIPEITSHWHQMKMMRPHRGRWLAEPVHHLGTVWKIDVAGTRCCGNGGSGALQGSHWGHDVNDRFCGKTRNRSASNVLGYANKPRGQSVREDLPFKLERLDPSRVVLDDLDRGVIHGVASYGLTPQLTCTQRQCAAL